MKKIFFTLIVLILTSCSNKLKNSISNSNQKLKIYTTIYPLYDFATKIAMDKADVFCIVPAGTEPHDFELTSKDMFGIENSDIFIYNGAGFEHFIDSLLKSIDTNKTLVVESSSNIELITKAENAEIDPHVWLSLINAKSQMEMIKNAIISIDSKNKDFYEKNFLSYSKQFDSLFENYKSKLEKFKNKNIIVSHSAFMYLCKDFEINQIAISGTNPEQEPTMQRIKEIIDFIKKENIKYIFREELVNSKITDIISKETLTTTIILNPLEGLTKDQLSKGMDYFSIMEENLNNLLIGLDY